MKGKVLAVIGGGASGVAAAHFLHSFGHRVHLFESNSSLGGRIGSQALQNRIIDFGGKNIGRKYPLFRQFVKETGDFHFEYFGINSSQVVNGHIVPIDAKKRWALHWNAVKMYGPRDYLKLARYAARIKRDSQAGFLNSEYFNSLSERYDGHPISHHFGPRFCKHFLRPVVVRMNGAEPDEYYLGNFGSNVKMAIDSYEQVTEGMHAVLAKFQGKVDVHLDSRVSNILVEPKTAKAVIEFTHGGRNQTQSFDHVIVATPAPIAADLLGDRLDRLSSELRQVRYFPVAVAVSKYRRNIFHSDVRALVFDDTHPLSNAGAYGVDDLDLVRFTFSGRTARERINENSAPAEVLEIGEKILNQYFPVNSNEREDFAYRYFKLGLCAFSPYHHRHLGEIKKGLSNYPALSLCGDYFRGASIEACFLSAHEAAERAIQLVT